MPTIVSYFFYEHSARRLLALLTDKVHDAEVHRDEHEQEQKPEGGKEKVYIDSLLKASKAVDEECKKLEFLTLPCHYQCCVTECESTVLLRVVHWHRCAPERGQYS